LGGFITSDIAYERTMAKCMEIFVRGDDGGVHHRWQTSPDNGWNPGEWDEHHLGGITEGNIAAGHNADGRLEIFVRGNDSAVYHRWQNVGGGSWNADNIWHPLEGKITGNITVGHNGDGRLEIFVRGVNNGVHHRWQDGAGGWHGWESLGGDIRSDVSVARNEGGRLEIFVRGQDNAVHHTWQAGGGWHGWESLGGDVRSNVAVARNSSDRLEIFGKGTQGAVHRRVQAAPNSTNWSDWETLDADMHIASEIAVAKDISGQMHVFGVRGADGHEWVWRA
jgi:hypothetical protein